MTDALQPRVHASTYPFAQLDVLLERAAADDPLVWMSGDDALVGVGETLRLTFTGPDRIRDAAEAWEQLRASAEIHDPVQLPGTGLVAFGSFAFADDSAQTSVLRVPRFVFGRRDGMRFVTEIRLSTEPAAPMPAPSSIGPLPRVTWDGARDASVHQEAVRAVLSYIAAGSVKKVVLARAINGELASGSDLRAAVRRLVELYPSTWVFAVDGLIGASPETLISVRAGRATLRVLAGTLGRTDGTAETLLRSDKDQAEHRYAVDNVTDSLARAGVHAVEQSAPYALELPELWHLASDVSFHAPDGNVLRLVDALHPTAAVAGSPTDAALKIISAFETIDRGRYAGPVGWLDAHGNAEWAIALRCAQVAGTHVTACAGGGIVAGSDPALEYAETELKLRAVRSAF